MDTPSRERRLLAAIVDVVGAPDSGNDVPAVLYTVAVSTLALLGAEAACVQIADESGTLVVVSICGEDERYRELFVGPGDEGPGTEASREAEVVGSPDLTLEAGRWPDFTARAVDLGFRSAHGVPLQVRDQIVGAVSLARDRVGSLTDDDVAVVQSLVGVAALCVVHDRARQSHALVRHQLEGALESRVVIEQAKGFIARAHGETPDHAFLRLRSYARRHGARLAVVSADVVAGRLTLG